MNEKQIQTQNPVVDLVALPRKSWVVVRDDDKLTLHRAVAFGRDEVEETGVFMVMNRIPKWVSERQVVMLTDTIPAGDLDTLLSGTTPAPEAGGGMSEFLATG